MKRRRFLAGLGGLGTLPLLVGQGRAIERSVRVGYWCSPGADPWVDHELIESYIESALGPIYADLEVTHGGVVPVQTEHGYDVMASGEWPLRGFGGPHAGRGPVYDANLLLTNGPLGPDPPGFARGSFAAIGGARHLESILPPDELPEIAEYDSGLYTMQLILHELGHTLGLSHEHGTVETVDDGRVASPMISGYAWSPGSDRLDVTESACGATYPDDEPRAKYLSMTFSACAQAHLQRERRWFSR